MMNQNNQQSSQDATQQLGGARGANGRAYGLAPPLEPGTIAPDFELRSTPEQTVQLSHFRGRPVVLVFYPADWSPVCTDQLALYQEVMKEFAHYNAQFIGISVDSVW